MTSSIVLYYCNQDLYKNNHIKELEAAPVIAASLFLSRIKREPVLLRTIICTFLCEACANIDMFSNSRYYRGKKGGSP
jgi:hypothetical protein